MKATREWGFCCCNCGKKIQTGDEFSIIEGSMFLAGHHDRRTRQMPVVGSESSPAEPASDKKSKSGK